MNIDEYTYLIYNKYYDTHDYDNMNTVDITLENILVNNDYKKYTGKDAIEKFNDYHSKIYLSENNKYNIDKIPDDLDMKVYDIHMYVEVNTEARITFLVVNNDQIDVQNIPNYVFLLKVCTNHIFYENARKNNKRIQDNSNIMQNIKSYVLSKVGDPCDPIIENPSFLNCQLYNYQKRSIKWMLDTELQESIVDYGYNDEVKLRDIFYDGIRKEMFYNSKRCKLQFYGGALIDEVGLGKTIQMITLSMLNPAKDSSYYKMKNEQKLFSKATLIICPNQLAGQWKREIEKFINSKKTNLNIVSILTKVHYDKYTYLDILEADFVIVSSAFLDNKCYVENITKGLIPKTRQKLEFYETSEFKQKNTTDYKALYNNPLSLFQTNINIMSIYWHRVIIDEFHEIYTIAKYIHMMKILPYLQSKYKWAVTGTPFNDANIKTNALNIMVDFVTGYKIRSSPQIFKTEGMLNYIKNNFFRHNTKKSINDEYKLKPIQETVVWLKFTQTERMMYNAYLANSNNNKFGKFLRQLCCHPKLADEIKSTLANCKTLDEIQNIMVKHYEKNMLMAHDKLKLAIAKADVYETIIKIYETKRLSRLLKTKDYAVVIKDMPTIDEEKLSIIQKNINKNKNINNDNSDEDDDDIIMKEIEDLMTDIDEYKENNNIKNSKSVTITQDNHDNLIKILGKSWNENTKTYELKKERLNNLKLKVNIYTKNYNGHKTTFEFYTNVIERIKKTTIKTENQVQTNEDEDEICGICLGEIPEDDVAVTKCGHMFCHECIRTVTQNRSQCPYCRKALKENEIFSISYDKNKNSNNDNNTDSNTEIIKNKQELINRVGTKLANLIYLLKNTDKHTIIFSQWDDLLKKVGDVLDEYGITNVYCKGNVWQRDKAVRTFNTDNNIKVIMLSSASSASGSNLTKASRVILLDPVYGSYDVRKNTEWQAIGRAHRMGQTQQVEVVRLIIKDTVEEEIYKLNFEEDKKFKENIKIFENDDDNILLSDNKLNPIKIKIAVKKNNNDNYDNYDNDDDDDIEY